LEPELNKGEDMKSIKPLRKAVFLFSVLTMATSCVPLPVTRVEIFEPSFKGYFRGNQHVNYLEINFVSPSIFPFFGYRVNREIRFDSNSPAVPRFVGGWGDPIRFTTNSEGRRRVDVTANFVEVFPSGSRHPGWPAENSFDIILSPREPAPIRLIISSNLPRMDLTLNVAQGVGMFADGRTFTTFTPGGPGPLIADRFVAVGGGGAIAHSTNGTNWTQITVGTPMTTWRSVSFGNGRWVAVGINGAIAHSTNGTVWAQINTGPETWWESVTFGSGRWIAVGADGRMAYSTNGINWTLLTMPGIRWRDVAFGNGTWVTVGDNGRMGYSANGTVWTLHSVDNAFWSAVAHGNNRWVVAGNNGRMAHSTNGFNWTQSSLGNNSWNDVAFGNGRFVAVGGNGAIAHSTNGINWTQMTVTGGLGTWWHGVTFANGKWVAVGNDGRMVHSTNGINWTQITVGYNSWLGVHR
jgi:hypothetical protein